jgi:hypothetical protein
LELTIANNLEVKRKNKKRLSRERMVSDYPLPPFPDTEMDIRDKIMVQARSEKWIVGIRFNDQN